MAQAKVEIFLDMSKYTDIYADRLAQLVNADVKNLARQNVAIKTTRLRNSIRLEKLGQANYRTLAETPYALAQEYGRPDLPKYTFTPYMRPAATEAGSNANINKQAKNAEAAARNLARMKK